MKKIIIVGGVAGGATAAARLRRLNEDAEIILFERGEHISFANCGLPYYIGETIKQREKLLVQTVEGMTNRFQLDIRTQTEVVKINPIEKVIEAKNLKTGVKYVESYDTIILSPGASPIIPSFNGLEKANNVFTLRNIPDTDRIKSFVDTNKPQKATVVGGGFIGLEMAENLVERGIEVTLVEMADQVMAPLDKEMAAIVHEHLFEHGIQLLLKDGVKAFHENGQKIELNSGKIIGQDIVILSIGVKPESKLAKEANIAVHERGGILVNEYFETSQKDIYAIGDAIVINDYIAKEETFIPLAGPANRQGRMVANNILGKKEPYLGTLGSGIAKVFELSVATTGLNEKVLQSKNKEYEVIHIHPASHATYYPGATPISLKVLYDKNTLNILGAQAVGKNGVDKRMDVIATAIRGNLSILELAELELTYAPPFSSAKDPVNMVGYVASNIIDDEMETIQWYEVDELVNNGATLIDVREKEEFANGAIEGAVNISLTELRNKLPELDSTRPVYVHCQVGLRGYLACRILKNHGYQAINVDGGYKTYELAKRWK
ncbi:CoA-disulfide reductase [Gracilibacillus marinus]|jgi:CoA-disulfide reductase|uniref:CoA-disulfide reductase n=1 Tax=Gracilibacillus marinus TaxID=630535 RepID=A0ABV8VT25_9BACI